MGEAETELQHIVSIFHYPPGGVQIGVLAAGK